MMSISQTGKYMSRTTLTRLLHAEFFHDVDSVLTELRGQGINFRIFETFRSAKRQAELYEQGRTKPGTIVTKAQPWSSYHQYGLAADIILDYPGVNGWDTSRKWVGHWRKLHEVAHRRGLETLSFELSHLQAAVPMSSLHAGRYPPGGGSEWALNLIAAIGDHPQGAPPKPRVE